MKARHIKIIFLLITISMISCSTVRVVKKRPGQGGILALQNGFIGESAESKAEKIMKSSCSGKGYLVTEEGEAVVGSRTSMTKKNKGAADKLFAEQEVSESETEDKTEWRLTYKCKGAKMHKKSTKKKSGKKRQ